MLGEILLKMVSVLTPDNIRQMKAAGCGDEVRAILRQGVRKGGEIINIQPMDVILGVV